MIEPSRTALCRLVVFLVPVSEFLTQQPYNYGPFNGDVYEQIEALAGEGLMEIHESQRYRTYGLTSDGYRRGSGELRRLAEPAQSFLTKIARWIQPLDEEIVAHEMAIESAVRAVRSWTTGISTGQTANVEIPLEGKAGGAPSPPAPHNQKVRNERNER